MFRFEHSFHDLCDRVIELENRPVIREFVGPWNVNFQARPESVRFQPDLRNQNFQCRNPTPFEFPRQPPPFYPPPPFILQPPIYHQQPPSFQPQFQSPELAGQGVGPRNG